ncbi:MAG: primase C-terminal domain-containing protein, partial [Rhodospirillaceae bacterium]|nr:primase C-terminal domain-containing protein [Rhodospirillaceae bacterium]
CAGTRPLWRRWQKRRPPLDICLTHPEIGLVPFSVGTSALDVDVGEIGELIEAAPPLVTVPSPRGHHSYYRDSCPRGNRRFDLFGCRGEVRSAKGFLRFYPGGPEKLAAALRRPANENRFIFPADLFEAARVDAPRALPVEGPRAFRVRPPTDLRRLELAAVGERNGLLFDHIRFWAYPQAKGHDLAAWIARVRNRARQLAALIPEPLPWREVDQVALSIATWTWAGGGPFDHSPAAQRRRQRRSAEARRQASAPRVDRARRMQAAGASTDEIMAATGASRRTVFRWLA